MTTAAMRDLFRHHHQMRLRLGLGLGLAPVALGRIMRTGAVV